MHPHVTVIIPTYNDFDSLKLCLSALEQQTYPADRYDVIAIDNSSSYDLTQRLADFPHATAIVEHRQGSYAARNAGIQHANGTVLAFTDADCIPAPQWLEKGVDSLVAHPDCGLVAGEVNMFFQNPDHPTAAELFDSVSGLPQRLFVERYKFAITANLFTYKAMFEAVGLFDADLKSGGDYEWGTRIYKLGYPLVFAEDAIIHHPGRTTLAELRKKHRRVVRGHYGLMQRGVYSRQKFFLAAIAESLIPFAFLASVMLHPSFKSWPHRLKATWAALNIRYVRGWERVQLIMAEISTPRPTTSAVNAPGPLN
ncbi:MAG: glycosyltransferase [Kaiparowitsia implicata GSE-PSE-MK54-09C]|jgi:glycosyltransferase involved in cell wall biosynthesis|nr:glycosyltransferase [Kaiparowitsia implicata GSE-PSE-MK54-09C]